VEELRLPDDLIVNILAERITRHVDYYFTPVSPWAFLGHARFVQLLRDSGASVSVRPVDFGAIFPASGGLPLAKRASRT
jgi:2-hydroxychromene-2-carboxylate isomerase